MLRTGVDIIEVERVRQAIARHGARFTRRVYTEAEWARCEGNYPALAARFAAKEAAAKALGTGIREVSWTDFEVVHGEYDRPDLVLHGQAAKLAAALGLTEWSISLSHTREHAVAVVVAQDRS